LLGIVGASVVIVGVSPKSLSADSAATMANTRVYIDGETGRNFSHTIELGETEPIESPFSGLRTAYAAEACYWKKCPDGVWKAKKQPT